MDDRLQQFLEAIKQIESSGGKDIDHPVMESGIHSGASAYGQYGLMPNTVREMAKRQGLKNLVGLDDPSLKAVLSEDPNVEQKIAEALAQRVLNRAGDEEKAAYMWYMGHNLNPENITPEMLEKHQYIQKFKKLKGI